MLAQHYKPKVEQVFEIDPLKLELRDTRSTQANTFVSMQMKTDLTLK